MRRRRRCGYCGQWFVPDRYNEHHHWCCGAAACRRARERQRQARYRQRHGRELAYRTREAARQQERRRLVGQLAPPPTGLSPARAAAPLLGVATARWTVVLLGCLAQLLGSESRAEVVELWQRCEARGRRVIGLPELPLAVGRT